MTAHRDRQRYLSPRAENCRDIVSFRGCCPSLAPPDLAASAIAGADQSTAAPPAGNQTSGLQGSAGGRDEGKGNSLSVAVCYRCELRMSAGRVVVTRAGRTRGAGAAILHWGSRRSTRRTLPAVGRPLNRVARTFVLIARWRFPGHPTRRRPTRHARTALPFMPFRILQSSRRTGSRLRSGRRIEWLS